MEQQLHIHTCNKAQRFCQVLAQEQQRVQFARQNLKFSKMATLMA